jgi:SAM-dependent methyltransferase
MRLIRRFVPADSVLDYGCGTGVFLAAAVEAGFTANVGADISADGLRLARQNLDDSVTLIHMPYRQLPERRFAVISLMDSLSAIPDARATLLNLKERHLADGGVLVVRTPDIPASYFTTVKALSWLLGRKQASRLLFADSRYALFDAAALQRFLEAAGFETVYRELREDYAAPAVMVRAPTAWLWVLLRRLLRRRSICVIARARSAGSDMTR